MMTFTQYMYMYMTMVIPLQYRGLAPMYYRGSAAAIVVYDITSEVRTTALSSERIWGWSLLIVHLVYM